MQYLAERLRLELRSQLSSADGLAIRSNTIIGPLRIGGNGRIQTYTEQRMKLAH